MRRRPFGQRGMRAGPISRRHFDTLAGDDRSCRCGAPPAALVTTLLRPSGRSAFCPGGTCAVRFAPVLRRSLTFSDVGIKGHLGLLSVLGLIAGFPAVLGGCSRSSAESTAQAAMIERAAATSVTAPAPPSSSHSESGAPGGKEPTPKPKASPPPSVAPDNRPRVFAKARFVWIRGGPTSETQWHGYLWAGGSVPLREGKPVPGQGCSDRWYPVEPRGWVCVDGEKATLDPTDPVLQAIAPFRPRLDTPWPHEYASVPGPLRRYERLPDQETQKAREVGYENHMARIAKARAGGERHPSLVGFDLSLAPTPGFEFPDFPNGLTEGRTRMNGRSTVAFAKEVQHTDRTFLLAADMSWVPKDRVKPYPRVEFQGIELGKGVDLPVAFFRGKDRPRYRRLDDGSFEPTGETFPRLGHVALTGTWKKSDGDVYYETKEAGVWVKKKEAVIPQPRDKTPWGAPVGKPDETGLAPKGRGTWLEASVIGGWLVAFEGTRAVYATMISAGRGGTPHGDRPPLETASTPTGWFPISGKFATATMDSPAGLVHSDVPWTQNFSGPHALHGAYWHNDWGNLKSAGCVNVSPRDGKWLFEFTEPEVPEGWHGVRYVSEYSASTMFIVHE